jgi:hypothetical protein
MGRRTRYLEATRFATGYRPEYAQYARRLALLGLPRSEIARNLGADRNTFERWCELFPDFRRALDEGMLIGDFAVVEALQRRCLGFHYKRKKFVAGIVVEETEEYCPPDPAAIQMWLYNRQPDLWRPVNRIEQQTGVYGELNARAVVEYPPKLEQPADDDVTDVQAHDAATPAPPPAG